MRVLFDRSAFHGERFEVLRASPLLKLVGARRVTVIHTPIFLEETVASFGRTGADGNWWRHLEYALDICNGGYFNEKTDIWRDELLADQGPHARYLLRERDHPAGSQTQLVRVLREAVATGDISDVWAATQADRDESFRKRQNQRATARAIRLDIAQAVREGRVLGSSKDVSFDMSRKSEFILVGRHLMRLVDQQDHVILADRWEREPTRWAWVSPRLPLSLYGSG